MNLMKPAIELSHVYKLHPLRQTRARSMKQLLLSLFRKKAETDTVKAAYDISLTVPKGQALGVIGANGAGKTTLLRLIADITAPTRGTIQTDGRILPLLELGAGFHPDLSGYENIFLQGVLMGLDRERVRELLPSIVEFAELAPFIHMPVRQYSSGMYLRLGFSISVHIEPDILLIDEAFSVGDLYFQQKSLERMEEFHARGGTFLLVTHDIDFIERVCDKVIWIDKGRIVAAGAPAEVSHRYRKAMFELTFPHPVPLVHASQASAKQGGRYGKGTIEFEFVELLDGEGKARHSFENGKPMTIRAPYRVVDEKRLLEESGGKPELDCMICIQSKQGHGAVCISTKDTGQTVPVRLEGGELLFHIDRLDLAPDVYGVTALFFSGTRKSLNSVYDFHSRMYTFTVAGRSDLSEVAGLDPPCEWEKVEAT